MIQKLVRYHQWAYQQLYRVVDTLTDEQYRKNVHLFFKSIHGTLNHLLLVERLWLSRLQDNTIAVKGLDEIIIDDRHELKKALFEQTDRWIQFVDQFSNTEMPETLHYKNIQGEPKNMNFEKVLFHVMNHGTHHRGQISAALTQLGKAAPVMDFSYSPF